MSITAPGAVARDLERSPFEEIHRSHNKATGLADSVGAEAGGKA